MRYIRTYENFKPIKVNNEKPFKVKKNIDKSIQFLQRRIKSLRKRLEVGKNPHKRKHSDMNRDKNTKIQQLKDLTFKQLKQNAYLRENPPVKESYDDESEKLLDVLTSPDFKPNNIENIFHLFSEVFHNNGSRGLTVRQECLISRLLWNLSRL